MITLQLYRLPHSTYPNGKIKRYGFNWLPQWSRAPYGGWVFGWLWWGVLRRDEIDRLRKLVASGEEHEEDCDWRNLSGDMACNCAGGRARAAMSSNRTTKGEADD